MQDVLKRDGILLLFQFQRFFFPPFCFFAFAKAMADATADAGRIEKATALRHFDKLSDLYSVTYTQ